LTLTNEEIVALLNSYDQETKALRKDALKLSWHMRGGITYDDAMCLSLAEKEIISKIVEDNLEVTKKTGLPYF
jgi:hypothetical protein